MADPAWVAIKGAIKAIITTLQESGTVTQEIGSNILINLKAIAETSEHTNARVEQVDTALNAMNMMVANEIKTLHDKNAYLQGVIDSGGTKSVGGLRRIGILESKAIANIKALGTDKMGFRMWNEKLINIFAQVRPGARKLFTAMMEYVDKDNHLNVMQFATEFTTSGA